MVIVEMVDTLNRAHVRRFVEFHYRLYQGVPQWVPPFRSDVHLMLNRSKHPFYEHSTADFFLAVRDGRDVGRIAALENRNYNRQHGSRMGQFYLFDCEDDPEAAAALLDRVCDWAVARGLDSVVGPKGFGPLDGYGLLERGYGQRQMMNMMNYNHPYYLRLVEENGFEKEVDFISHYVDASRFELPERIHRIAERVKRHQGLRVVRFRSKSELRRWAGRIGRAYNNAFVENWEYVPLTQREVQFTLDNILLVAVPSMIKIIAHGDDVVGFAFAFPDVSAAMQRCGGRLTPWGVVGLLRELRRTEWVALNGNGILPEFQGRGGNALLYSEMHKTLKEFGYRSAELTQIAESAVMMRRDLETLGGEPYKNHRVYRRRL